jgi:hypothetical protein
VQPGDGAPRPEAAEPVLEEGQEAAGEGRPQKARSLCGSDPRAAERRDEGQHLLVYCDEAHIRLDADLGYGWSVRGARLWVCSDSPGLAKVSFYGPYLYNHGQVEILPRSRADGERTVEVLDHLRQRFPDRKIKLAWDGASYHRSARVQAHAAQEVTYHRCHASPQELTDRVDAFRQGISRSPWEVADRPWVKDALDPDVEKLRISK